MISFLRGKIVQKTPEKLILDVNGVGYEMAIPLSTYQQLADVNEEIQILTYMYVRENLVQLYGFLTTSERNVFLKLLNVSGIGPQVSLDSLSALSPHAIKRAIITDDVKTLTRINRVGKKTAQRILLDLKDAFKEEDIEIPDTTHDDKGTIEEAVLALVSLGYKEMASRSAIVKAIEELEDGDVTVENLIKQSLKFMQ
jgi:Holliday junction DNA helicase RuvA